MQGSKEHKGSDRGVIIMEYNIDVIERGPKWPISTEIYISPDNFSLYLPATIEFKIVDFLASLDAVL